jgi:ribosomal protein S25
MVPGSNNHNLCQQVSKTIDPNKKIPVTQLYVKLQHEPPVASQHLANLEKAGVVSTEHNRKFVFYTINSSRIEAINR